MKALICALNTKFVHSSLAPWYLKASVDKHVPNIQCDVYESTINESEEKILTEILEKDYDLIGFSTYIWNVKMVLSLCGKIKKIKDTKIVLGGPEVSYNIERLFAENNCFDYIISGEGEVPFAELCANKSPKLIDGLCYRENGKVVVKAPCVSSEEPASPYTEEYFASLNGRIAYIETSRGCPYHCAFCLSGRCGTVRFFDVENAKRNIISLAKGGVKTIKFVDRTFNADKERAREIFSYIIDNYGKEIPTGVCFHFELEGDILDKETIELLSQAPRGSIQVEVGLQSFNENTLRAINRKSKTERLCENVKSLLSHENIHVHIDLIAGLPYEDYKSFSKSFNKALSLRPHMLQFGFLKLLYGSDLREKADEFFYDYDENPPYEIKSTKWLTSDELKSMHTTEDFFDRFYNSGRFLRTVDYICELFDDPFDLFKGLGEYVKLNEKEHSLDEFTRLIFDYLLDDKRIDPSMLRDCMALDRLASNRMGNLPEFLKIHSPKLKEYLNFLEENPKTKKKSGVKRAITLLKTKKAAVYVDYEEKNPVTGQYNLNEIKI